MTYFSSIGLTALRNVIWAMHLHENGRYIEITTLDKTSFTVDVTKIARLSSGADSSDRVTTASLPENLKAFHQHKKYWGGAADDYIPVLINGNLYSLAKNCEIKYKPIFDAVTKGIPV